MKLARFFLISAALHAVVFFYPVRFITRIHEELIPVTVLGIDDPSGGAGGAGRTKATGSLKPSMQAGSKKNVPVNVFQARATGAAKVHEETVSTNLLLPTKAMASVIALSSEAEQQPAPPVDTSFSSVNRGLNGSDAAFASLAGAGAGGNGSSHGYGEGSSGTCQGSGTGSGFAQGDVRLIQARYRETPKPLYPERARREGQQGQVLLRVLVDQQGRTKSVEVSRSSGSETLDHAAIDAIRLWRFSPARYGDKPVESWVRIPVDFRLTDLNDH